LQELNETETKKKKEGKSKIIMK